MAAIVRMKIIQQVSFSLFWSIKCAQRLRATSYISHQTTTENDVMSLSQTPQLEPLVQVWLNVQPISNNYHSLFMCLSDKVK